MIQLLNLGFKRIFSSLTKIPLSLRVFASPGRNYTFPGNDSSLPAGFLSLPAWFYLPRQFFTRPGTIWPFPADNQSPRHADSRKNATITDASLENAGSLEKIHFDVSLLEKTAETADRMSDLPGAVSTEPPAESVARVLRDRAFTHCKKLVTEVREHEKYVFYRNDDRYRG